MDRGDWQLQSMGLQVVGHNLHLHLATDTFTFLFFFFLYKQFIYSKQQHRQTPYKHKGSDAETRRGLAGALGLFYGLIYNQIL